MDYSPPGSTVQGIFRARILEWVAISFSRRSSRPRDWTPVSHVVGRRFTLWATHQGLEAEKIKEANVSLEPPKKTLALLMLFKPSETRVGLLTYLEKNKDNLHLTLQGEIWTFIHRPNAVIQTKHPRSTGEGQTAGDLWKGFGKGK